MNKSTLALLILFLFTFHFSKKTFSQSHEVKMVSIAFYNLENLFDTINDPEINDEEFLPEGSYKWNSARYKSKLAHLAEAISQIGDEYIKGGPSILGMSEIENRKVIEDLINTEPLKSAGYSVVHYDSPDRRGVDVGLIYQPKVFKVTHSAKHRVSIESKPDWFTRDILVVAGMVEREKIYVLVNHWPSRSGGELETVPLRAAAAETCRKAADSIFAIDPKAKIIIMGDLNDDPTDASLQQHLKAKHKISDMKEKELYNPMFQLFRDGIGSLAYRDSWNLFDQLIISTELLNKKSDGFQFYKAKVFNRKFLLQKEGQYKGYPFRTYAGGVYTNGYSDHLPVYLMLTKEKK